jgi:hypothetical protein
MWPPRGLWKTSGECFTSPTGCLPSHTWGQILILPRKIWGVSQAPRGVLQATPGVRFSYCLHNLAVLVDYVAVFAAHVKRKSDEVSGLQGAFARPRGIFAQACGGVSQATPGARFYSQSWARDLYQRLRLNQCA